MTPKEILKNKILEKNKFTTTASYKKGDNVVTEETFCKALGLVISGKLKASNRNGNKTVPLNTFEKDDLIGAASLFGGDKISTYSSLITAEKDSVVIWIDEENLKKIILKDSEFALAYIEFLSEKIRLLNRKISGYTSKSAAEKLLLFIENKPDKTVINPDYSKISKALGIGRTSIYRARDELSAEGKIVYDDNTIKAR